LNAPPLWCRRPSSISLSKPTSSTRSPGGEKKEEEALGRARSIVERAAAADDRIGELCGRIQEEALRISLQPEGAAATLDALIAEALPVFGAAGNDLALRIAYRALGDVANMRGQMDKLVDAYERAEAHAGPAGLTALVGFQSHGRFFGATPLTELLTWQDEQDPREQRSYWLRTHRVMALAMLGRLEEARTLQAELRAEAIERGATSVLAAVETQGIDVELLAGDPAAAVTTGEESCRLHAELGHRSELSTAAGGLAHAYYEFGGLEEAGQCAARSRELGSSDDATTQMLWRQAQAKVQARRGQHAEAERLAREAVEIGEATQSLNHQADTYADLGEVMGLAGRPKDAAEALEQALSRYEAKENVVMAGRMRERLAAVRAEVG
jgi:tetratricopeptide (TPR) repeat protein